VGDAKYIYGLNYYRSSDLTEGEEVELVAVADKTDVYFVRPYFFNSETSRAIEKAGKTFSDYRNKLEERVKEVAAPLLEQLPVADIDGYRLEDIREDARTYLINSYLNGSKKIEPLCQIGLSKRQVMNIFCGFKTIDETVKEVIEEKRDTLCVQRSYDETFKKYLSEKETLADWEVGIVKAVAAVPNAKTLTINKDRLNEEKISTQSLINSLKSGYSLPSPTFQSCADIEELSYNGKTLYKKSDYEQEKAEKSKKRKNDYERD
jgi:hypothetical protein